MIYSEGERGKGRKGKGKGKGGRERERGREGERKRKRKRERGREKKTGDGFVITESFSYLCMRDRYLDRQTNRTSIVPPLHIKTD